MMKKKVTKENDEAEFLARLEELNQLNPEFASLIRSFHYSLESLSHYLARGGKARLDTQGIKLKLETDFEIRIQPTNKVKFTNN